MQFQGVHQKLRKKHFRGVLCKKWKIPEGEDHGKFDINPGGQLQNVSISSTGGGTIFSVKHNEARGKNLKIQGTEM